MLERVSSKEIPQKIVAIIRYTRIVNWILLHTWPKTVIYGALCAFFILLMPLSGFSQSEGDIELTITANRLCVNSSEEFELSYTLTTSNLSLEEIEVIDLSYTSSIGAGQSLSGGYLLQDQATETFQVDFGILPPHQGEAIRFTLVITWRTSDGLILSKEENHFLAGCPSIPTDPVPTPEAAPVPTPQGNTPANRVPLPQRFPAIICDPAEINCTNSIPQLGVKFNAAQDPLNQPVICASDDPRQCIPNLPTFGLRFREAYADILAGECRVLADDVIALPEYHDALNRQADPAAAFMRPLYDSGVDFKKLVFENIILGIRNTKNARQTLQTIHTSYWKDHNEIVAKVLKKDLAGSDGIQQLNRLLDQWRQEVTGAQNGLNQSYTQMQEQRRAKFDPVADTAVSNAEESIAISCPEIPEPPDGGLEILLYEGTGTIPAVKEAYDNHLTARLTVYAQTQTQFAQLNAIQQLWQQQLYPALTAFDQGNPQALTQYSSQQGDLESETFQALFQLYYDHQKADETGDNIIRLDHWEVALDTPKEIATDCEKENVFNQPVETTQCESGDYPEFVIRGAPIPEKAKLGGIAPPDTSGLQNNAQINPQEVQGVICGGRPGDPQWANDCSCQCGEPVLCDGEVKFCEQCSNFGRHDIMVTSREECIADGAKHEDPFF